MYSRYVQLICPRKLRAAALQVLAGGSSEVKPRECQDLAHPDGCAGLLMKVECDSITTATIYVHHHDCQIHAAPAR